MRIWSRMTARIAAALGGLALGLYAGPFANSRAAIAAPPAVNQIEMELKISGTGLKGFELEIRPGHRACSFQTIKKDIEPGKERSAIRIESFVAESISPDRDCCFEIIIREPGQPNKSIKRGIRLDKPKPPPLRKEKEKEKEAAPKAVKIVPVQRLTYYLASPAFSVIEKDSKIR